MTDKQRIGRLVGAVATVGLVVFGLSQLKAPEKTPEVAPEFAELEDNAASLNQYNVVDPTLQPTQGGKYSIPVDKAMAMVAGDQNLLNPVITYNDEEREMTAEQRGELLFSKAAPCATCHKLSGPGNAPSLGKRWGQPVELEDGTTTTFDAEYVRRAIIEPDAEYAKGYGPDTGNIMPTLPFSDQQINDLIAFLKAQ